MPPNENEYNFFTIIGAWVYALVGSVFVGGGGGAWGLALPWRHNERDCVSNHQPHDCLLNRLFSRRSKKTSKFHVTCLCEGNSPVTGEFPAQRASNAENVSIWWRHHGVERKDNYRQTTNISHTFVGNGIVDHSDVVGAAPTTTTNSYIISFGDLFRLILEVWW